MRDKCCPKSTFLGLCEDGQVSGIPAGKYIKSKLNKEYALLAVGFLQASPSLASDPLALWGKVMAEEAKVPTGEWRWSLLCGRRTSRCQRHGPELQPLRTGKLYALSANAAAAFRGGRWGSLPVRPSSSLSGLSKYTTTPPTPFLCGGAGRPWLGIAPSQCVRESR